VPQLQGEGACVKGWRLPVMWMMGSSAGFQGAGSGNGIDIARFSSRILWSFQTAVPEVEMDRASENGLEVSDLNNNLRILACATR